MSNVVQYARQGRTGVITVDYPPVNALGLDVRTGLLQALEAALADAEADVLVLAAAGRTFMAGADIREFGKPSQPPILPDVIARFDASPKPIVAAIHGTALGGGLELALACHFRVALRSARLGLPEVKLGLLPGSGGTQRLPRLIGAVKALDMIISGDPVSAAAALEMGIIDALDDGDSALDAALRFAQRVRDESLPAIPVRERTERIAGTDPALFAEVRAGLAKRAPQLFSPHRCVDAVEAAVTLPFEDGLKRERELFLACMDSPQRAGLIHAFFAEREAAKVPGLPAGTPLRPVRTVAVIGAGTMGGGIAMCFANAGIPVLLLEVKQEALDKGVAGVRRNYEATAKKGKLTAAEVEARMGLIRPTLDYADLKDADLVIEAVFENMAIKKQIFATLDRVCKPGAILATNTSTLDIDEIATATRRPQDVVGMHFFSPANVMKLLENVRGAKTADDVAATVMEVGKRIGKVSVLVGVCYGFVGNRMLHQRGREAVALVDEGASPQQVDKVLTDFGFPMGQFAMGDLAGIDVGWRIREERRKAGDPDAPEPNWVDKLAEQGRFGQKTGAGIYRYEPGSRTPLPDPEVEALIAAYRAGKGIAPRAVPDHEILERCLYVMVNEGARILEEGIAARALDVDVVWIYGYGFPAYRGGPMFWADRIGLKTVYEAVKRFHETLGGTQWEPAPLLERLAREGKRFGDL
ncbi:3-hydroxyacyl-CoA dehydrogenase NAD-binding domain-containing protein [Azospirillum sp. TSO22-1]|uniref:3-hydroxyacyl-CoA dehydrogenase NAD-binding domain-containing protein n=1 Tax=Azospirillum sp. TSO22-1 TaxID=716789 RepID=UPI000D61DC39|nr:3-hydroxyacyl-CoA dehydrogenase NAD-binding domain-containing protein [Azospirillum sp. TSO22-1]PWC44774.1 3-hydroxyacyl-CoA dehydrogenase [Azospirillum sp. TSO22-1]